MNMRNILLFILCFFVSLYTTVSQTISDSLLLPETLINETKEIKHSIGIRIENINTDLITNSISESFADFLQKNTTIYVKSYGALNTPSFRGTSSSHTLFLWNGIPVNSVASGLADLRLLPISNFNNMSISYGGNSSVYGTGSVGGSINLNNFPKFINNRSANLKIDKGSFGLSSSSISFTNSNDKIYCYGSYSKIIDSNNFTYNSFNNLNKVNEHSLIKGDNINTLISYKNNDDFIISLHFWRSYLFREIPPNMTMVSSTAEQVDRSERILLDVSKRLNKFYFLIKHSILFDNLYYTDISKNIDSYYEGESNITEFDISYNYDDFYGDVSFVNNIHNLNNSSYSDLFMSENSFAIFSALSYRSNFFSCELSARDEYNSTFDVPLIPSISIEINLNNKIGLRSRINKNFRSPTFNDRFWIGSGSVGNINLLPEKGVNREMGFDYSSKNISNSVTLFSLNVDNWILWQQLSNGIWTPENLKNVVSKGIEYKSILKYKIFDIDIYNEVNYQYNISTNINQLNNMDNSFNKQLIYTPVHNGNINSIISFNNYVFRINKIFTGSVFTSTDNHSKLPPYFLFNSSLKYYFENFNSEVILTVNNILNKNYQTYLNYPNPGIEYLVQLNIILI